MLRNDIFVHRVLLNTRARRCFVQDLIIAFPSGSNFFNYVQNLSHKWWSESLTQISFIAWPREYENRTNAIGLAFRVCLEDMNVDWSVHRRDFTKREKYRGRKSKSKKISEIFGSFDCHKYLSIWFVMRRENFMKCLFCMWLKPHDRRLDSQK